MILCVNSRSNEFVDRINRMLFSSCCSDTVLVPFTVYSQIVSGYPADFAIM